MLFSLFIQYVPRKKKMNKESKLAALNNLNTKMFSIVY